MTHERHIIGALLIDPGQLDAVLEIIGPDEFQDRRAKAAYTAIIRAVGEGLTPDLPIIAGRIRDQVDGSWLAGCWDAVASASLAPQYAREQAKIVRVNKIRTLCHEAAAGKEPNEMMDKLYGGLVGLEEPERQKDTSARAIVGRYREWVDDCQTGKKRLIHCHTPGLVDEIVRENSVIPYWLGGLSVVISAYTTTGKSAYIINMALKEAECGVNVLLLTNEMGECRYVDRAVGYFAEMPYGHVLYNKMTGQETDRIRDAENKFAELPIHIQEGVRTVDKVAKTLRRMEWGVKPDLIILDYLQNLVFGERTYEGLSRASNELIDMGKRYDVPIVMVSQIDNQTARQEGPDTNFMAVKGSGDVASDCSIFCQLVRNPIDQAKCRDMKLIVRKNQMFGKVGYKDLVFNAAFTRISERAQGDGLPT